VPVFWLGYKLDGLGYETQHHQNILSPPRSCLALGSTQSPIQWVLGDLSQGVKWRGHKADHSHPSSTHKKNEWIYTSTPTTCLHNMHRNSFTFLLPFYSTQVSIPFCSRLLGWLLWFAYASGHLKVWFSFKRQNIPPPPPKPLHKHRYIRRHLVTAHFSQLTNTVLTHECVLIIACSEFYCMFKYQFWPMKQQ